MKCIHCGIEVFYGEICDDCWECECGKCDSCTSKAEQAYENYLSDFYGNSEPFTLKEKHDITKS